MSQRVPAVGIDLGTTYSVIAYIDDEGRPRTLQNAEGDSTTPSVVYLDKDKWIVGKEAVKAAVFQPDCVASHMKRDMGESAYSRLVGGKNYKPELLQSLVLEKLKHDAEQRLGPIRDVVITVPAYFTERQRHRTVEAGTLAGLNVLEVINEPTAAAIAFGAEVGFLSRQGDVQRRERILVYDLGGGTFDVTVMEIHGNEFQTLASEGEFKLGGFDWNQCLVDYVAEQVQPQLRGKDLRDHPRSRQRLERDVEEIKRALSLRQEAMLAIEDGDNYCQVPISRDTFEELTADLMERTRTPIRVALEQAGLTWKDITRVLLVGGSTRMPAVETMLTEMSGMPVDRTLSADEAVAHGAALYASFVQLQGAGRKPTAVVRDISTHSVGIRAKDANGRFRNSVIVKKNTPLPASNARMFKTATENQRRLVIDVLEGESLQADHCSTLGRCVVDNLPPGLPPGTPLEIGFNLSRGGQLVIHWRIEDRRGQATIDRDPQTH